jgi:hypothetical protein
VGVGIGDPARSAAALAFAFEEAALRKASLPSSTLTRDVPWSACRPAPTSWCSAGTRRTLPCPVLARSGTLS